MIHSLLLSVSLQRQRHEPPPPGPIALAAFLPAAGSAGAETGSAGSGTPRRVLGWGAGAEARRSLGGEGRREGGPLEAAGVPVHPSCL